MEIVYSPEKEGLQSLQIGNTKLEENLFVLEKNINSQSVPIDLNKSGKKEMGLFTYHTVRPPLNKSFLSIGRVG